MMESLQQEKQNLWRVLEGHCTKWVSSSLPRQFVHFNSGVPSAWVETSGVSKILKTEKLTFEMCQLSYILNYRQLSTISGPIT